MREVMDKYRMPLEERVEIAVPAFLRNSVADILSVGKSVQIIKSFNPNFVAIDLYGI